MKSDYVCVTTVSDIVKYLGQSKIAAFDFETAPDPIYRNDEKAALDPARAHIVGCSFSVREGSGIYVPLAHCSSNNINKEDFIPFLKAFLTDRVGRFCEAGIRTSVFVAADEAMVEGAKAVGSDRVELYTEPYATDYAADREAAIAPFIAAARKAQEMGLGLNAGHDLSLENLRYFHEQIPWLDEVSIGHALICDALYLGLKETIARYLGELGIRN